MYKSDLYQRGAVQTANTIGTASQERVAHVFGLHKILHYSNNVIIVAISVWVDVFDLHQFWPDVGQNVGSR